MCSTLSNRGLTLVQLKREVRLTHTTDSGVITTVDGLRTLFRIIATPTQDVDVSTVSIYNLSDNTAGALSIGDAIRLETRRVGEPYQRLFESNIAGVRNIREEADTLTEITISSLSLKQLAISESFQGRQPLRQVVTGIIVDKAELELTGAHRLDGYQVDNAIVTGGTADAVNTLIAPYNLVAYQVGNQVRIYESGVSTTDTVRLINAESGMIGVPEITSEGVRVRIVLDGSIEPQHMVRIASTRSPSANGDYRVVRIMHVGDTGNSPDWYTELDCNASS